MASEPPKPIEAIESWFLSRVARAVEADEVPADFHAELQTEFEASREKPPEQSRADAVRDIASELRLPIVKVVAGHAALEAQPTMTRELPMRRIAEAWLEGQRRV